MSDTSFSQLEERFQGLEHGQADLRSTVEDLNALYNRLCKSVEILKRGGWDITVGPFKEHHAGLTKAELDYLLGNSKHQHDTDESQNDGLNGSKDVKPGSSSYVPPYQRKDSGTGTGSIPHLRAKPAPNGGIVSVPPRQRIGNGVEGRELAKEQPRPKTKASNRYQELEIGLCEGEVVRNLLAEPVSYVVEILWAQ